MSRCAAEASATSGLHSCSAAANKMSWKDCYKDNKETTWCYIIANVIKCKHCLLLTPEKPSLFSIR